MSRELRLGIVTLVVLVGLWVAATDPSGLPWVAIALAYVAVAVYGARLAAESLYAALNSRGWESGAAVITGLVVLILVSTGLVVVAATARAMLDSRRVRTPHDS